MVNTMHYPPLSKYDVIEEYADAARNLSDALSTRYDSIDDVPTAPTWQTEPPTEAGWYPAMLGGLKPRKVVVEIFWRRVYHPFETDGKELVVGNYLWNAFTHWWPIPITMPEPPEGV